MLDKFKDLGSKEEEVLPSFAWMSLARRGMEKISLDQCFLPNCDNENPELLETTKVEEEKEDNKQIKFIHRHCKKCGGDFQIKLETIERVAKPSKGDKEKEQEETLSMGLVYALDASGKNLGHLGYF